MGFHVLNVKEVPRSAWLRTRHRSCFQQHPDFIRGCKVEDVARWYFCDSRLDEDAKDALLEVAFGGYENTKCFPVEMTGKEHALWGIDPGPAHLVWTDLSLPDQLQDRMFVIRDCFLGASVLSSAKPYQVGERLSTWMAWSDWESPLGEWQYRDFVCHNYHLKKEHVSDWYGNRVQVSLDMSHEAWEGRWAHTDALVARAAVDHSSSFWGCHLMTEQALLISTVDGTCAHCALDERACVEHWPHKLHNHIDRDVSPDISPSPSIHEDRNTLKEPNRVFIGGCYVYEMQRVRVRPTSRYYLGESVRLPPWVPKTPGENPRSLTKHEYQQLLCATRNTTGPLYTITDEETGKPTPVLGRWSLRQQPAPWNLLEIADDVPWSPIDICYHMSP